MNHSVISAVVTGLVAAVAGIAIAGLPSDPPGSELRITAVAATTTTTAPPVVTAASTTTATTTTPAQPVETAPVTAAEIVDTPDEPAETTPPSDGATSDGTTSDGTTSDGTTSDATAPNSTDAGADSTDSTGDVALTPRDELIVIAANAGSRAGIATDTADILRSIGYARAVPLDADETSGASDVYYRAGLEEEALRLAADLGWSEGDIAPLDRAPAFTSQLDVDLVVVLGQDSR